MKKSVWTETKLPEFEGLKGDIKCDVLIIGGGLSGLLCAHFLKKAGVDCVLVEQNRIAGGITKNTTAKITLQHGLIYSKLINSYGREKAQMYLGANQRALAEYENMCKNIDCDYEKKDAYTYSLEDRAKVEEEVKALQSLGYEAQFAESCELPFEIRGAVRAGNQAQFHPLKFVAGIAEGLKIYENTCVRELVPGGAAGDFGKIRAEKIIVCTHFPFINKHGSYFLKLYQHRSYVSAFENAGGLRGMYVDEAKGGMSFRDYGGLLFIGGGGHRTGKQSEAWRGILEFAKKHYPEAEVKYEWATQDCMSLDGVPYIGKYSKNTENMYVATGFNKWGISSSMAAAMILSDMVQGRRNEFAEVFSPQRSMLHGQLLVNGVGAVVNLLTPSAKRCPHMGCALKWNKAEHTWDCPCHGSRFTKEGKVIDNPAEGSIRE